MRQTSTNELGQPVGPSLLDWSPRPFPEPGALTGRYCRLEPLVVEHAPALYDALTRDPSGGQWTYLPYGPFADAAEFTTHLIETLASPGWVTLTIVDLATGKPGGWASYLRIEPAIGCIEVGGIAFGAGLRHSTAATEAMYLMAAYAIENLGYRRYEWKCDDLNAPSRSAARRLGFRYEGTWRNATMYKNRSRDTAWFAITDDDWTTLGPILARWLDPSNFDAGRQRRSLSELTRAARRELDA